MPVKTNISGGGGGGGTGTKFRMFSTKHSAFQVYYDFTPLNIACGSQRKLRFSFADSDNVPTSPVEISVEGSDEPTTRTTEYTYSIGDNPYIQYAVMGKGTDNPTEVTISLPKCKYAIIKDIRCEGKMYYPIEVEIL